jgi:NDP-sugar pyrophosphorylase family protein
MKAMILAAGLGTRLRPLTDTRPKALVEIAGRTFLEITLTRLRGLGVDEVIINVHHFADMVVDYLKSRNNFGMRIEISREDDRLLDTGGGLKKAAWFFLESSKGNAFSPPDEPFLLHNVDVISTIDFRCMLHFHNENRALATLAVQSRESSRLLLFNEQLLLCGRADNAQSVIPSQARNLSSTSLRPFAFSGIHVVSPRLLRMLTEEGVFPIIDAYIRLAAQGEKIFAFRADEYYWRDVGRPSDLCQAALDLQRM